MIKIKLSILGLIMMTGMMAGAKDTWYKGTKHKPITKMTRGEVRRAKEKGSCLYAHFDGKVMKNTRAVKFAKMRAQRSREITRMLKRQK